MFKSFRSRLIATVIGLVIVTTAVVGVGAYVLVRNSLRGQLVDDAVARAEFNIVVLATPDQLAQDADRAAFEASGLAGRFLLRGTGGVYVEFASGEPFASSLSLLAADAVVSAELRRIVAGGDFGYEFLTLDGRPTLAVAGRRPPSGPDFYFFDSAADVDNALSELARVLILAGIGLVILAALSAGLIARGVLRPVAVAGAAAGRMAEGDLSVRLEAESNDELGRLADAFNQMAVSLEQQITALVKARDRERRFVADVSHELRTPLTALVNEATRLGSSLDELPAADRPVGEMLISDVRRLSSLVEDLLEVSRLDAAAIEPELSVVDLPRFLGAVLQERLPTAQLEMDQAAASVITDRRALERIVGNLLDNAAVHAPGATVTVTAGLVGDELAITVADDGPGVAPADLPHIFDRFYKTDVARRGGSGLGLAIARQHARHHGGELTARLGSTPGLVFELRLPVAESLHSGDGAEKPGVDPGSGDEFQNRRLP